LRSVAESLTGEALPKQFCRFRGPQSLLQLAILRVLPLVPPDRCVVVVTAEHRERAEAQVRGFRGVRVVDQPGDCGTAAGVLLPLSCVLESDPRARVLLLPSDHIVADEGLMLREIDEVDLAVAQRRAGIVLFGVVPDAVHGDYGWIEPGEALGWSGLRRVAAFWEKPGVERATELRQRGAVWNTMTLLARAKALRRLYTRQLPAHAAAFRAYGLVAPEERPDFLREMYRRLKPADFSRDLIARSQGLAVHAWPAEIGWSDVGTPPRLFAWLDADLHAVAHAPAPVPQVW